MRDLRYAIRVLAKSPLFTLTAVLTLALCIGANTAIFTVVDRVLLRALPYPQPQRLVQVTRRVLGGDDQMGQTGATWEALRDGVTTLDLATTAGGSQGVNLVVHEHPEYVKQFRVSAGFFRVLGVAPEIGREFTADEDTRNGPAVTVLSHGLWVRLFGGDPSALGRSIMLRGEPYTIVGVMPASFTTNTPADLWTPVRPWRGGEAGGNNYTIIGRLKPGATWAQAATEVAAVGGPLLRQMFQNARVEQRIVPLQRGETDRVRRPLVILWAAVGAVLLIGCVNIAALLLSRASARAPEIATRIALGGGRAAIVGQLLAESVVLAALGGIGGLAIGYASSRVFATLLDEAFGVTGAVGLDARVLAICGGAALGTSVVFGLFPSLQASRVDLRETLVAAGSNAIAGSARSWPRRAMVVAEVALSVMLLVGAGLLIRTFDHLMRQRPGFDDTHLMTASLSLLDARYRSADTVNQLFDRTLERMRAIPGVENAAVSLTLPYERALNTGGNRWIGAKPGERAIEIMNQTYVSPGYFATLRIPLIRGRVFTAADNAAAARVMVVNQSFVKAYSPDQDPIGRQMDSQKGSVTVVGIVGDIQEQAGWGNFGPVGTMASTYIPAAQTSDAYMNMVHTWFSPSWLVRLAGPQEGIVAAMQSAVQSVDPLLPFAKFRTLDDVRGEAVAQQRAQAWLLGSLAGLALLLAAIGLYGLVANAVAERTRELGIRIALGATPAETVRVAARPGVVFGAVGLLVGLALARAGSSVLEHLVWGVSVGDPLTYAGAAAAVLVVALVATLVPSLKILRVNPIRALRQS
jgi:predicted permease